jgi:RNA-directed DNA polymerase
MRIVQYKMLTKLLNNIPIPEYIHAFEIGKNIPEMAQKHTNKKIVISLDLKDFFPSIKQSSIKEYFIKQGFGEPAALTLAELCTYKFFVPQGALTSPKISNIISAETFGPEVKEYCDQHGWTMTIYADDITISSDEYIDDAGSVITNVQAMVNKHGFRINHRKTKIMTDKVRQWVCGVVTNTKINLLRRDRLRLRAIVHNVGKNGIEAEAAKSSLTPDTFVNTIQGKINWYRCLNPQLGGRLYDKFKTTVKQQELSQSTEISAAT